MALSSTKIVSLEEMIDIRKRLRQETKRLVLTNGCFDIIHLGHVRYLEQAKALGSTLVVGLNSDSSVKVIKGEKRPIMGQQERAGIIAALASVDYVVVFDDKTAEPLVDALEPDVYVKGGDYAAGRNLPEADTVASYGGRVVILPFVAGHSTTDVIRTVIDRYGNNGKGR